MNLTHILCFHFDRMTGDIYSRWIHVLIQLMPALHGPIGIEEREVFFSLHFHKTMINGPSDRVREMTGTAFGDAMH